MAITEDVIDGILKKNGCYIFFVVLYGKGNDTLERHTAQMKSIFL